MVVVLEHRHDAIDVGAMKENRGDPMMDQAIRRFDPAALCQGLELFDQNRAGLQRARSAWRGLRDASRFGDSGPGRASSASSRASVRSHVSSNAAVVFACGCAAATPTAASHRRTAIGTTRMRRTTLLF